MSQKRIHSHDKPLNPQTSEYHFLGPVGAFFISLGVPFLTYALLFGCNEGNACRPALRDLNPMSWSGRNASLLWDTQAALLYAAGYAYLIAAWAILPGKLVQGTVLRDGTRKTYKLNAFTTFLLTMSTAGTWIFIHGPGGFTFLFRNRIPVCSAVVLMSIVLSLVAYAWSFRPGALLALGGNTGSPIYDIFIGRELNPAIGSFDLKTFNELRPGLILWALMNVSMACEQAVRLGGRPTASMLLVCTFQLLYVADAVYNEDAILTTMDITTDGCGFMLTLPIFWEPFVYGLQARYLVFHPVVLSYAQTSAIIAVQAVGYYIFRASNGEKNDFRNGRNPKNLRYITTESGRKLLTSGWWGFLRHPNYLGDLLMALAWSLPTGFDAPLTYFYFVYFFILLVHRNERDNDECHKKYGKDWQRYTNLVPYSIIPYVY